MPPGFPGASYNHRGTEVTKTEAMKMKMITANVVALMLVIMLGIISVMAISGYVDLTNPATSLFVGSLIGNICGLLAPPLVWYFGHSVQTKGISHQNTNGDSQ